MSIYPWAHTLLFDLIRLFFMRIVIKSVGEVITHTKQIVGNSNSLLCKDKINDLNQSRENDVVH